MKVIMIMIEAMLACLIVFLLNLMKTQKTDQNSNGFHTYALE